MGTELEGRADELACSALRKTDSEEAALLFRVAREIYNLSLESTDRIECLKDAVSKFESAFRDNDLAQPPRITTGTSRDSALVEPWGEGTEPRLVSCLRLAGGLLGPAVKGETDYLIGSILSLEAQYEVFYRHAQAHRASATSEADTDNWKDVLRGRIGCYCCDQGCHICENCQPHLNRETSLRAISREVREQIYD